MSKDYIMTSLSCMIVYLEIWITIETIENGLLDNGAHCFHVVQLQLQFCLPSFK